MKNSTTRLCKKCGAEILKSDKECINCGKNYDKTILWLVLGVMFVLFVLLVNKNI